jgi:hypothetical protein
MRPIPNIEFWRAALTSRPVRVFWVLDTSITLSFIPEANSQVLYEDRFERSKIIMSDLPADYRFKPATGSDDPPPIEN